MGSCEVLTLIPAQKGVWSSLIPKYMSLTSVVFSHPESEAVSVSWLFSCICIVSWIISTLFCIGCILVLLTQSETIASLWILSWRFNSEEVQVESTFCIVVEWKLCKNIKMKTYWKFDNGLHGTTGSAFYFLLTESNHYPFPWPLKSSCRIWSILS